MRENTQSDTNMSLSVLSIPQHILLRELGGVITFGSFGRKKVQRRNLLLSKHSENGLCSLTTEGLEDDRRSDSTEHLQNELSHKSAFPHPRINFNIIRHSFRILRDLLCSKTRYFVKKGPVVSEGTARVLIYADGKIFVRNKVDKTYDCLAVREKYKKLYTLPCDPKWEDASVIAHSTANFLTSPVIIVLRKGNLVQVHDLETGTTVRTINLCNIRNFDSQETISMRTDDESFSAKELHVDFETSNIIIKTTRNPKQKDILVTFFIFNYPSFSFMARIDIRRSVFGHTITDAEISEDIIMVMESGSKTKLYSIHSYLAGFRDLNSTVHKYSKISKTMPKDINRLEAQNIFNADTPAKMSNVQRKVDMVQKPHCLYEVKSFEHNVQFSTAARMTFIDCGLKDHKFKLNNISSGTLIQNGIVGMRDPEGMNHLLYHPDDSSRAIYLHSPEFSIYEFQEVEIRDRSNIDVFSSFNTSIKMHKVFNYSVTETDMIDLLSEQSSTLENDESYKCYRSHSNTDIINFHSFKDRMREKKDTSESRSLSSMHRDVNESVCSECGESFESSKNNRNIVTDSRPKTTTTKSGRKIVQRISTTAYDDLIKKRHFITYDYEDELDILVILTYNDFNETYPSRDDDDEFFDRQFTVLEHIMLLDNTTYKIIKRIPMNEIIRDNKTCSQHNISVTLDRETLMVKLQSGSNTEAFVYQIFENPGEEEDGIRINSVSRSTRFQKGLYLE